MTIFGRKIELTTSVIFLIAMNAIPVFGVFAFGWDVGTLLLLYWLESVVDWPFKRTKNARLPSFGFAE